MKQRVDWMNEEELFGEILEALSEGASDGEVFGVVGRDEEDGYGGLGYIEIKDNQNRRFHLELHEII